MLPHVGLCKCVLGMQAVTGSRVGQELHLIYFFFKDFVIVYKRKLKKKYFFIAVNELQCASWFP